MWVCETAWLRQYSYWFFWINNMERHQNIFIVRVVVYMWLIDERMQIGIQWCCYCVRMDDDSCVMKYIEIVPRDQFEDCSDVTDVKCEPLSVKVSSVSGMTIQHYSYFIRFSSTRQHLWVLQLLDLFFSVLYCVLQFMHTFMHKWIDRYSMLVHVCFFILACCIFSFVSQF